MSEKKNWGSTVLGWFVVQPGDETPSVDINSASTQEGDGAAPIPNYSSDVSLSKGGHVDFDAVFDAAGIDAELRAHCTKAAELLAGLPTETDAAIKKQIVEVSLKAFGVPIEKIIEAGVHEIQALEGYIQSDARDTRNVIDESQRRIAQHEQEIEQIKTVMLQRNQEQQSAMQACNERKLQVQRVLEFFGQEAVARVVRDSPKLTSPPLTKGK